MCSPSGPPWCSASCPVTSGRRATTAYDGSLCSSGCSFLIYAWYALPFVVLVLMAGRWEWLAVWPAMYVAFVFDRETYAQTAAYGLALVVVGVVSWRRRVGRGG